MKNEVLITALKRNVRLFHQVVPFHPGSDKLIALDFTAANKDLVPEVLNDTRNFTAYINDQLLKANARYGIGGYAEHRTVYSISRVFDGATDSDEPRRLHLGVDIWGKPNTAVMTPMDGIVHSFAFNDRAGDYGATIILTHVLDGISFHTLYGHLSLASISDLHAGDRIVKGDVIGGFGIPAENGHWPPHLHFQLIDDMGEWKGDYPGVCKFSEREKFFENCPDPDLVLGMNSFV